MNPKPLAKFGKMAAIVLACLFVIPGRAAAEPDDGYEILTRGPVHEAFASTVNLDPEPGMVIDTAPPGAIEELPPEQRLEGDNVVWIPGYWAWDEEQGSFLWVSGVWRNLPPGREWIPGYWNPVADQRHQWISGYWSDTEHTQVSYLPAPPRSIESGPSIAAGSADDMWLPGSWVYQQNKYAWRAGHWAAPRENWIYVPAHYVWTPRGHVFVDGYWDHAVPRRGVVFAPVHFHRPVYASAGYRYSPRLAVNLSVFTDHLFLRPSYGHYYFGDYYAPVYKTKGFRPWHEHHKKHRCYDPVYAYTRWCHRKEPEWERNCKKRYDKLCDQESARPPRTWAAMQSHKEYKEPGRTLAAPIEQYAVNHTSAGGQKFRKMDRPEREKMAEQTREVRNFGKERQKAEGRADSSSPESAKVEKAERSKSPIASRERSASPETSRGKKESRTPGKSDPPEAGPDKKKPEIAEREKDRPDRGPERSDPPSARPSSDQGGTSSKKANPPERKSEQAKSDQRKSDQRKSDQPKSGHSKSETPKSAEKPRRNEETRPAEKTKQEKSPQHSESKPQRDAKPERGKGGGEEEEKGGKKREK